MRRARLRKEQEGRMSKTNNIIIPSHEEFNDSKTSFRFHIEINVRLTTLTLTVWEREGVLVMCERLHLYGPTTQSANVYMGE